ncbi:MAG: hypothetical protein H6741_31055 [Alphaproteobacteria bacterium]|nr:hypothetical protein [Alphaproteobacteria bacterium]
MTLHKRWLYALAGLALGLGDTLVLLALGAEMRMGELDILFPTMALFSATFGAFGFMMGRLAEARVRLAADAALIRAQVTALEEARDRLVAAETLASLGRMAASVAHEVRNPLGVIRSSAALIEEGLAPESEDAEAAQFILEEVDRLDDYVGRILDYARPLLPERRPVDLGAVAARARRLIDGRLEVEVEGATPEVEGDEELLVRLLLGLLVNAAEAGASRVRLRLGEGAGEVRVDVCDDGEGVPEGAREMLFEPFFTTKAQGTGLGLALARRVAEAHGGGLELVEGEGTCFRLSLPEETR